MDKRIQIVIVVLFFSFFVGSYFYFLETSRLGSGFVNMSYGFMIFMGLLATLTEWNYRSNKKH